MQHRLIVMWAPPRSLSTAFVRVIEARGDFTILHEPLCDMAACGSYQHRMEVGESARLESHEQLFGHIQSLRSHKQVFVKDTCEYSYHEQLAGSAYLREAQHVFMLRDPEKVINSHYHINPELSCEEVGYANLARLYDLVKEEAALPPVFIDADELAVNAERVVTSFCGAVGLRLR